MATEVAVRELRQRFIARERARMRQPFVEEHERLLLARTRTEADEPLMRETPEDMDPSLTVGRDPSAREGAVHGRPRQHPAAFELLDEDPTRTREHPVVDPEGAEPSPCGRYAARGQKLGHPAGVLGREEVKRPSHRPSPYDASVGDRLLDVFFARLLRAQADRPERRQVVLALHGAEP